MPNRFKKAAEKAREMTNKQLTDELATVTTLQRDRLNELLPLKKDKEIFAKLMMDVEAETNEDEAAARIGENIKTVGPVIVKILKFLV